MAAAAAAAEGGAAEAAAAEGGEGGDGEMEVDAPPPAAAPAAAAAATAARDAPRFVSEIGACVPTALQKTMAALEAANMSAFARNGDSFESYFRQWDLTVHTATSASGELLGFAISGAEGRGKVFLYELHVDSSSRKRGVARALLDLVERSSTSRGRGSAMVELNAHTSNTDAQGFYKHVGFVQVGSTRDKLALVMQRKR